MSGYSFELKFSDGGLTLQQTETAELLKEPEKAIITSIYDLAHKRDGRFVPPPEPVLGQFRVKLEIEGSGKFSFLADFTPRAAEQDAEDVVFVKVESKVAQGDDCEHQAMPHSTQSTSSTSRKEPAQCVNAAGTVINQNTSSGGDTAKTNDKESAPPGSEPVVEVQEDIDMVEESIKAQLAIKGQIQTNEVHEDNSRQSRKRNSTGGIEELTRPSKLVKLNVRWAESSTSPAPVDEESSNTRRQSRRLKVIRTNYERWKRQHWPEKTESWYARFRKNIDKGKDVPEEDICAALDLDHAGYTAISELMKTTMEEETMLGKDLDFDKHFTNAWSEKLLDKVASDVSKDIYSQVRCKCELSLQYALVAVGKTLNEKELERRYKSSTFDHAENEQQCVEFLTKLQRRESVVELDIRKTLGFDDTGYRKSCNVMRDELAKRGILGTVCQQDCQGSCDKAIDDAVNSASGRLRRDFRCVGGPAKGMALRELANMLHDEELKKAEIDEAKLADIGNDGDDQDEDDLNNSDEEVEAEMTDESDTAEETELEDEENEEDASSDEDSDAE